MGEQTVYTINLRDLFSPKLNNAANNLNNFEKKFNGLTSRLAGLFTVTALGAGIKKISDLGAAIESTRIQFQVFVGDVEKGNKLLGQLKNYANITPYLSKDILDAGRTLLAFGVNADKIMPTIQMLGDVAAGDAERLKSLSLAFGQMSAAGRLMGQDLLQMVNAGFNPLQIISQKTGISMAVLRKKMEEGKISVKDVTTAFKSATQEGGLFFKMTEKQSQTFGGKMSTLIDTLEVQLTRMGETLNKTLGPILDKILKVLDTTETTQKSVKDYNASKKSLLELQTLFSAYEQETNKEMKKSIEGMILNSFPSLGVDFTSGQPEGLNKSRLLEMIDALETANNSAYINIRRTGERIAGKNKRIDELNSELSSGFIANRSPFDKMTGGGRLTADDVKNRMEEITTLNKEISEMIKTVQEFQGTKGNSRGKALNLLMGAITGGKGKIGGAAFDIKNVVKKDKEKAEGDVRTGGTKNITINIQNLLKVDEFNTNNFKGDEGKVMELVKRALLTALNDANLAVD